MPRIGPTLYGARCFREETYMRQLIESFSPEARPISWKWIGGIFAFYVAVLLAAAGAFMAHQSAKTPVPESAVTASGGGKPRSALMYSTPLSTITTPR
jgi:hypothetical protein